MYKKLALIIVLLTFLASLTIAAALIFIMRSYDLTLLEAINKSAQKLSLVSENKQLLSYSVKYEHEQVERPAHAPYPRIFFKELHYWDGKTQSSFYHHRIEKINEQKLGYKINCQSDTLTALINCYLYEPTPYNLARLEEQLKSFSFQKPNEVGSYGNGWQFAFVYDLVKASPHLSPSTKYSLDSKAATMLIEYLNKLDGDSASLFHGRATLAANAFLLSTVLDDSNNQYSSLYSRAYNHFSDFYRGMSLVEIWPEGYNYWINERALQIVLALSAFKNMQTDENSKLAIERTIKRIGLWHIYFTRPDFKIEGWGDEGPRVDLKDETLKVIDLIAQITQEEVFIAFSQMIKNKYKSEGYFRGYRWLLPLLWDGKSINSNEDNKNLNNLLVPLNLFLPKSEIFGKNYVNQLSIRNDWSEDATFITFRAGDSYTHHQHYDAGHFSIFKGSPLALNASDYRGDVTSDNRKYFAIRTLAKNSLLIQKPYEVVRPNRLFDLNVADGGQRIVMPTGSAIASFQQWQDNRYQGKYYAGAELIDYQYQPDNFTAITSDLTNAYNSIRHDDNNDQGKVKRVERTLVYLNKQDLVLIYDSINSTDKSYKTKWLLHSVNMPFFENLQQVKGVKFNGISRTRETHGKLTNLSSELTIDILSPAESETHIVGGPTYKYYVEIDGDDKNLDGQTFPMSGGHTFNQQRPEWRIEISPSTQTLDTTYLVVLQPRIKKNAKIVKPLHIVSKGVKGKLLDSTLLLWDEDKYKWNISLPNEVNEIILFSNNIKTIDILNDDKVIISEFKINKGFNFIKMPFPIRAGTTITES